MAWRHRWINMGNLSIRYSVDGEFSIFTVLLTAEGRQQNLKINYAHRTKKGAGFGLSF
jgi:hypothetical protein